MAVSAFPEASSTTLTAGFLTRGFQEQPHEKQPFPATLIPLLTCLIPCVFSYGDSAQLLLPKAIKGPAHAMGTV